MRPSSVEMIRAAAKVIKTASKIIKVAVEAIKVTINKESWNKTDSGEQQIC